MKIISEVKLTDEQVKNYRGKGYEVYYGYENPVIKKLYDEYFEKCGSHKAHELLHTHYVERPKYSEEK